MARCDDIFTGGDRAQALPWAGPPFVDLGDPDNALSLAFSAVAAFGLEEPKSLEPVTQ